MTNENNSNFTSQLALQKSEDNKREITYIYSKLKNINNSLNTIQNQIENSSGGNSVDLTQINADITSLQQDLTTLQTSVGSLSTSQTQNASDITNLQTALTTAQSNLTILQSQVATNTTNIATNTQNISSIQTQVATNTQNITTLQNSINNIGGATTNNNQEVDGPAIISKQLNLKYYKRSYSFATSENTPVYFDKLILYSQSAQIIDFTFKGLIYNQNTANSATITLNVVVNNEICYTKDIYCSNGLDKEYTFSTKLALKEGINDFQIVQENITATGHIWNIYGIEYIFDGINIRAHDENGSNVDVIYTDNSSYYILPHHTDNRHYKLYYMPLPLNSSLPYFDYSTLNSSGALGYTGRNSDSQALVQRYYNPETQTFDIEDIYFFAHSFNSDTYIIKLISNVNITFNSSSCSFYAFCPKYEQTSGYNIVFIDEKKIY